MRQALSFDSFGHRRYGGRSMTRLRRALGAISIACLFCQTATPVLVPVLLLTSTADVSQHECTCPGGGADAACPMHHHKTMAGSKVCLMQGLTTNAATLLHALAGVVGLMSAAQPVIAPVPMAGRVRLDHATGAEQIYPPDSPPPRA